jgi:signal transduction histidine kinase
LAVCKKIVERYGGEIGATPAEPKGTCFWFTLPAVKVTHPPEMLGNEVK